MEVIFYTIKLFYTNAKMTMQEQTYLSTHKNKWSQAHKTNRNKIIKKNKLYNRTVHKHIILHAT